MEVDCKNDDDITSDLLLKFSCMNTTEKEVLADQFRAVLGEKGLNTNAEFWLDMNNWNLESAVCSYYDFEAQNGANSFLLKLPSSGFASDPSFSDRVPPNSPFVFRCALTNNGDEAWPIGCALRFIGGTPMTNEERILLPNLLPGQSAEIHLSLLSPKIAGCFQCKWRPSTLTGQFFGEMIFIIINVTSDAPSAEETEMMDDISGESSSSMLAADSIITLPPSIVIPPVDESTTTTTTVPLPFPVGGVQTSSSSSSSSSAAAAILTSQSQQQPSSNFPTDNSMDAM